MDRGAWRAIVHRVTKSQTWLKRLSMHHACGYIYSPETVACRVFYLRWGSLWPLWKQPPWLKLFLAALLRHLARVPLWAAVWAPLLPRPSPCKDVSCWRPGGGVLLLPRSPAPVQALLCWFRGGLSQPAEEKSPSLGFCTPNPQPQSTSVLYSRYSKIMV